MNTDSGFLYGKYATSNPDSVERISSNVPQIYNHIWRPLELGAFSKDTCHQPATGTPVLEDVSTMPYWSSQTGYVVADCLHGASVFCQTDLMYKQCNPESRFNPVTDPMCGPFNLKESSFPW